MRGLKQYGDVKKLTPLRRIFYRCVDWNGSWAAQRFLDLVASFTDAWIETRQRYGGHPSRYVASFTDAWIETFLLV